MTDQRRRTTLVAGRPVASGVVVSTVLVLCAVVAVNGAASGSLLSRRVGTTPLVAPGAVRLGAVPDARRLVVDVALQPRSPAALARYATEVSTPGDPQFRHFLTRGRFASEFGPTPSSLATVRGWLAAQGLDVEALSSNHLTMRVAATAGALDRALSVGLERFSLPDGRQVFANTRPPLLDGDVSRLVQGVVGLDDVAEPRWLGAPQGTARPDDRAPSPATVGPTPCPTAVADAAHAHAYTANQLASAYGLSNLYAAGDEGAGITIALFEQETDLASDVAEYQSCYGTDATVAYVPVDGGAGGVKSIGEAAEDIEVTVGLAPKATIDVFEAPPTSTGTLDDYTAIVDRDTAQVVSTSWGQCEAQTGSALLRAEGTVFEQAAVQGQSVFAASGDSGSSGCSTRALAVVDPASQPYVTGVGGTKLTAVGPPPTEAVWNESATSSGAGGGGLSSDHVMPSYQASAPPSLHVVNANSSGVPCGAPKGDDCREVPDVSADADYGTGYLTYENGRWEANGGTSAGAPLWAALTALADGSKGCGERSIGFANPALYDAAATAYASDFHDVTTGSNDDDNWGDASTLYPAGVGYDMATGLGTPNGANLARTLCADAHVTIEPTTTRLSMRTTSVTYGAEEAETFTVRVTGRPDDGRPIGSIVVFNVTKKLCSHLTTAATSDQSVGRCTMGASSLRVGRHGDVVAVFDPNVGSSSSSRYHYTPSRSRAATLVVRRPSG